MNSSLIFKQFRSENGCNSFLVADLAAKSACIIDPRVDELDLLEAYVGAHSLSVDLVLDTHTHADHFSGTHLVAERFQAPIAMAHTTQSARAGILLRDGQEIGVGSSFGIKALATPGHTPDSMCFLLGGSWGGVVFTGDTLFIGGSGRTDFPQADAREQYNSIYKRLGSLDGKTWVLPGHDYSGLLFSTIEHEKRANPHWAFKSADDFVRMKEAEALESSGILQSIVDFNLNAKPLNRPRGGAHTMCATVCAETREPVSRKTVQELQTLLAEQTGALFVDVRETDEFARSRIEGMVNIPLGQLFFHWEELKKAQNVYFFCQRGNRSLFALQTARRLGFSNVQDIEGGILAWIAAGLPVSR